MLPFADMIICYIPLLVLKGICLTTYIFSRGRKSRSQGKSSLWSNLGTRRANICKHEPGVAWGILILHPANGGNGWQGINGCFHLLMNVFYIPRLVLKLEPITTAHIFSMWRKSKWQ